ncbi:MAG: hypothetical protein GXY86_07040 [Firmicutes bacterium]|nr:hypothetical protein [Bacillota bacterium]
MLAKDPTEELVYHLMRAKKCSLHFGEISLGVKNLLDAIKEQGCVVHLNSSNQEINLIRKQECESIGIEFEHQVFDPDSFH